MKDAEKSLNDSLLEYNNLLMNAADTDKKDITYNFGRRLKELLAFKKIIEIHNMKHHH
jgi:hypothetical protein